MVSMVVSNVQMLRRASEPISLILVHVCTKDTPSSMIISDVQPG